MQDPHEGTGLLHSHRGPEIAFFGGDVTAGVLQNEGLNLLIRSHDWPQNNRPHGHQWFQRAYGQAIPKLRGQGSICLSVFTASDYCGTSGNHGACVIIRGQGGAADEVQVDEWTPQQAMDTWNRARTVPVGAPGSGAGGGVGDPLASFPPHHEEFLWGLKALVVERKHELFESFQRADVDGDLHLPVEVP
jgi:hypothetical protein